MRDLEKSGSVRRLCMEICGADKNKIHFDYDGVISLLEQAQALMAESARCPRPETLPVDMAWDERLYKGENFNSLVYSGTMEAEDFLRASAACLAEADLDESEDAEI